jgi:hypothetical protein
MSGFLKEKRVITRKPRPRSLRPAPTRGALAKIALLDEHDAMASCSGIDCASESGCTSANDDQIPRLAGIAQGRESLFAVHR